MHYLLKLIHLFINMKKFTSNEYKQRLDKTLLSMAKKGVDTLLVSDPANIYNLSRFDPWSF